MRRLGLIDHVSRFNQQYAYREAWTLANRLERVTGNAETKDRNSINYV